MELAFAFLTAALCCIPALFFRAEGKKRWWWLYGTCIVCGGALLGFSVPAAELIFAFVMGACILIPGLRMHRSGVAVSFCLCWSAGLAVLCGRNILTTAFPQVSLLCALVLSAAFSVVTRLLSRWTMEDSAVLSEERRVTPLLLLSVFSLLALCAVAFAPTAPGACAVISIASAAFSAMVVSLWNEMRLAVTHSVEGVQQSQKKLEAIDKASRNTDSELYRQLAECRSRLEQLSAAFRQGDMDCLGQLLSVDSIPEQSSYSSNLLLDAVLRSGAARIEKAGMRTDFSLLLGELKAFSASDLGVILDIILDILSEPHPSESDTVRLRVQKWNKMLVISAGRRAALRVVPEVKREALNTLAERYQGWTDFTQQEKGTRFSVVLFEPAK